MKYYIDALRKFATFSGRTSRAEYWMFFLYNTVFSLILFAMTILANNYVNSDIFASIATVIAVTYFLAMLIPNIAILVRRAHDINLSGLWIFLMLIPLGQIAVFIFTLIDSTSGDNKYGSNPKGTLPSSSMPVSAN